MKALQNIKNWNDGKLAKAVFELRQFHDNSILPDGVVREFVREITEELKFSSSSLILAENTILKEAAGRYWSIIISAPDPNED